MIKNKVKQFRVVRDITQEQLASSVQITRQSLIAIEKNKYNPSLELALKLCEFFNCKVEDLFQLDKTGEEKNEKYFNQKFISHLTILLLGSALLYFNSNDEEKISSVLLFAGVYILFSLILFVVKRIFFKTKRPMQRNIHYLRWMKESKR